MRTVRPRARERHRSPNTLLFPPFHGQRWLRRPFSQHVPALTAGFVILPIVAHGVVDAPPPHVFSARAAAGRHRQFMEHARDFQRDGGVLHGGASPRGQVLRQQHLQHLVQREGVTRGFLCALAVVALPQLPAYFRVHETEPLALGVPPVEQQRGH